MQEKLRNKYPKVFELREKFYRISKEPYEGKPHVRFKEGKMESEITDDARMRGNLKEWNLTQFSTLLNDSFEVRLNTNPSQTTRTPTNGSTAMSTITGYPKI